MVNGQAAMEFITTYGWAILTMLAAIGALTYLGVLRPSELLPEKCQFPLGAYCLEKPTIRADDGMGNGYVGFVIKNSLGHDIKLSSNDLATVPIGDPCTNPNGYTVETIHPISANGVPGADCELAVPQACTIENGGIGVISLICQGTTFSQGKRIKTEPSLTYTSVESGAQHTIQGDIQGKVST